MNCMTALGESSGAVLIWINDAINLGYESLYGFGELT